MKLTLKDKIKKEIKTLKSEIKEEKADAKEHDETMGCCDKSFSDGYIRGLEVGLVYLKSIK